MRTYGDDGKDTLHMVSNFLIDRLRVTGSGSKTYSIPPGSQLYLGMMVRMIGNNNSLYCSGSTVYWSIGSNDFYILILCRSV